MARASKKAYSTRALRDAAQQFKMLGDPTRLYILGALANGGVNVGPMALLTGMSQPAVSHHLSLLRAAKFVEPTRDGKAVVYTLTARGRVFWDVAEKVLS
jgi:DNA-binding transcriptional ArsR family regulator